MKIKFRFEEDKDFHGMDKESSKRMEEVGNDFFQKLLLAMDIDLEKKPQPDTIIKSIAVLTFVDSLKDVTSIITIEETIAMIDIVSDSMKKIVRVHEEQKAREKAEKLEKLKAAKTLEELEEAASGELKRNTRLLRILRGENLEPLDESEEETGENRSASKLSTH